jgi:hypothetical protein
VIRTSAEGSRYVSEDEVWRPRINRDPAGRSNRKGDGHSSVNHDGRPVAVFMVSYSYFVLVYLWFSSKSEVP